MNTHEACKRIEGGELDSLFSTLYGEKSIAISHARERYVRVIKGFERHYGSPDREIMIFSVPGRSEICGNHTDHNRGKVVASSIGCDMIGVASVDSGNAVRIRTEGFREDVVTLPVGEPDDYPRYKSGALVAGMCRAAADEGINVGGFCAFTSSDVPKGSGLSSSAAFEVLVGAMAAHLFGDGAEVSPVVLAKHAQYAENVYFGKPCGLMDQLACAVGGIIAIDFSDPASPGIEKSGFDLEKSGYCLCLVNTGGCHSDLNEEYSSIPSEMKSVAHAFGLETLRGVTRAMITGRLKELRAECGDRAVLRALHYTDENARVDALTAAMKENDCDGFLKCISASGDSSWRFLQNICQARDPREQGIAVALALTEDFFAKNGVKGACRVHGGGFAGTAQAFLPREWASAYCEYMNAVFGQGACTETMLRPLGAIRVL